MWRVDVRGRLEQERNVWLATTRADGRPHLTPIWFVYVRDRIWIATGRDNVKTRNVGGEPRVSVALEDGNTPVVAEGVTTIHAGERPADVVDAFLAKYGWDITVRDDADVGRVVLWEIDVAKWLFAGPE